MLHNLSECLCDVIFVRLFIKVDRYWKLARFNLLINTLNHVTLSVFMYMYLHWGRAAVWRKVAGFLWSPRHAASQTWSRASMGFPSAMNNCMYCKSRKVFLLLCFLKERFSTTVRWGCQWRHFFHELRPRRSHCTWSTRSPELQQSRHLTLYGDISQTFCNSFNKTPSVMNFILVSGLTFPS